MEIGLEDNDGVCFNVILSSVFILSALMMLNFWEKFLGGTKKLDSGSSSSSLSTSVPSS